MLREKEVKYQYLKYSSPDKVYDWLECNSQELQKFDGGLEIEEMLLARNNALINLGLALFSINEETRNHLYYIGDVAIQKAVLSNRNCGNFLGLEQLLKDKDSELINIFLRSTEDRLFLIELFKRKGIFSELDKDYWTSLLTMVVNNPILTYPYSEGDREWGDDISEISHATRLFNAVYGLFNLLDVNDENARLLAQLLKAMPAIQGQGAYRSESFISSYQERLKKEAPNLFNAVLNTSDSKNVSKILEKWKYPESVSSSEYRYYYENRYSWDPTLDDEYQRIESKCWRFDAYVECRFHLAFSTHWSSSEIDSFKDSDDVALRMVYYRAKNFNLEPSELIDNWGRFAEVDGDIFYANIVKNPFILYSENIQDFIGDGVVLTKEGHVEEYQEKINQIREKEPDLLKTDSERRLEYRLDSIKENISTLKDTIDNSSIASYKRDNKLSLVQIITMVLVIILFIYVLFFR